MATARLARLSAPRVRPLGLSIVAAAAALAAVVAPATATSAAPQLTLGQVQARVAALNTQAERITEAYNAARDQLRTVQRDQKVAADQLGREQARLSGVQAQISATASATYRSGGFGNFVLGAADPQTFLDQAVTLDAISRAEAVQFATAAAAGHAVKAAKASYDAKAVVVHNTLSRISSDRSHINGLLAQARSLLDSLRAADRARLAAAQARSTASQVALRGTYHGPASGRAAVAVRFAYNQLGKPYVYGAAGPNSYDCSGLTMAAWGAAGVSLSHNAAAQQSSTHSVSSADMQPGDLVFFGYPAYHVGLYIGNGNMIAAPHTGDVVKIESISGFSSAGRP